MHLAVLCGVPGTVRCDTRIENACPAPGTPPPPSAPRLLADAVEDRHVPELPRHRARRRLDHLGYATCRHGHAESHDPGHSLEALLAIDPGPWRNADVLNYGVGASNTQHWLAVPPAGCGTLLAGFPVVEIACRDNVSWIEVVSRKSPDLVVVDLGLNDALVTTDPEETVDRLVQIRDALSPVPVAFFPPIAPPNGPRGAWPWHVREAMERRGLFAAEYPAWLPTFDRLHPTDGGYAAKAGLWLDAIHQQP